MKNPLHVRKTRLGALLIAFVAASAAAGLFTAGLVLPVAGATGLLINQGAAVFDDLPEEFDISAPSQKSVIYAADGSTIAEFYADNRIVVPLEEIALPLQQATVAIEDRRFLDHRGVDVEGLARAAVSNLAGKDTQGASTLTQQFVKNIGIEAGKTQGDAELIEDAQARTLSRKAREARLAVALERQLTKSQILAGYLNIAQFGPSVYGVEAASRHYFSKSAKDLSISEAALLAGLPQSPNGHDPVTNPESATKRRAAVLAAMKRDGYISAEQAAEAGAIPVQDLLKVSNSQQGCGLAGSAAYFCSWVVSEILNSPNFGQTEAARRRLLLRGGLAIHTTLDPKMQADAFNAINKLIPVGDASGVNIAISAIEPGTGQIKAMAQNTTYGVEPGNKYVTETSYNADRLHGGEAGFQTGSTFKIFTLAQWFAEGRSAYTVVGGRRVIPRKDWKISCAPGNAADFPIFEADSGWRGPLSVLRGTYDSVNGVFGDMASQLDLCDITRTAAKVGVTSTRKENFGQPIVPVPASVLGVDAVPPLNMANAYASFAARGVYCRPVAITAVEDANGNSFQVPDAACHQAISPEIADKVTTALSGVMTSGTGRVAQIGRPSAGKTGTADLYANTWFAGYIPQLAAAVWVGRSEGGSTAVGHERIGGRYYGSVHGSTIAAPAWRAFMVGATQGMPVETLPKVYLGPGGSAPVPIVDDEEDSTPATGAAPTGESGGDQGAANTGSTGGGEGTAGNVPAAPNPAPLQPNQGDSQPAAAQ